MIMNLDEAFERIYIISMDNQQERKQSLLRQLNELGVYEPKIKVFRAVNGDATGIPAWWRSGGGAWGCLMSHAGVIQDAVKDKLENYLVLEDDAILCSRFDELFESFFRKVPENWQQLYLGGQNLLQPTKINSAVLEPKDMNRTHAYALSKSAYKLVHGHILHAPDYIEAYNKGWFPHIDHQLGSAHRRGDWKTYSPVVNLIGQKENQSFINGRWHPDKWWDWPAGDCYRFLPYVIVENDGLFSEVRGRFNRGKHRSGEVAKYLHFGWSLGPDKLSTIEGWENKKEPAKLWNVFSTVASEAFEQRRLPAFYGNEEQKDFLRSCWPGGTLTLSSLEKHFIGILGRLKEMTDYPWNGILKLRNKI